MRTAFAISALAASAVALNGCVVFDKENNLYALGGKADVSLGAASTWASPKPKALATSGRPPFTGTSVSCFLSQTKDIIYVLGADKASSNIYVYNPSTNTWSTQKVSASGAPNFSNTATILDHDTDVFFALEGTTMKSLDFSGVQGKATSGTMKWIVQGTANTKKTGFVAAMAEAQNHVMIFGGDGSAGQADVFVVHFSSFQKKAQTFKTLDSTTKFPSSHGQAVSFFQKGGVAQRQLAFIPDDFSSTYVLTHWTSPAVAGSSEGAPEGITPFINTTQILPAPTVKDKLASYGASPLHLVQLTSTGKIYAMQALTGTRNVYSVQPKAKWTLVNHAVSGVTSASGKDETAESSSSSDATATATGTDTSDEDQDTDSSAQSTVVSAAQMGKSTYGGVVALSALFSLGVAMLF